MDDFSGQRPVAVLFSGGDSPGMNACLRAVSRLGLNSHATPVLGVRDGYRGLVRAARLAAARPDGIDVLKREISESPGHHGLINPGQDLVLMNHSAVSGIVGRGGILLGSARCEEFLQREVRAMAIDLLNALGVRALIVCGGNGSLQGAHAIASESSLQVIGIPGTIDNDLLITEMALGVDTAVSTLVWAVEHFKDTARSHRRVMILETMGRDSGELAVRAAISSGAEIVITPEQGPLTDRKLDRLASGIEDSMRNGRTHAIVLVAEGVRFNPAQMRNKAWIIADAFKKYFRREGSPFPDLEVRPSVLGHLQRGGNASPFDALLAARFADCAWRAISAGEGNGITALRQSRVQLVPFGSEPAPGRLEKAAEYYQMQIALSRW